MSQIVKYRPAIQETQVPNPGSGRYPGKETGYSLQYSSLENSTGRKAVHAVNSQTQLTLSLFTFNETYLIVIMYIECANISNIYLAYCKYYINRLKTRKTLESPLDSKEIKPSNPKEINPEYLLERLMLKLQFFGHLMGRADSLEKTLVLGKIEGMRIRE